MQCIKFAECQKINVLRDKDILESQFVDGVNLICGACEQDKPEKAVVTLEIELRPETITDRINDGCDLQTIKDQILKEVRNLVKSGVFVYDLNDIKVEVK